MPSIEINEFVNVDVDDFLNDCTTSEIDDVLEWLKENDHYISQSNTKDVDEDLIKLLNCLSLTNEDDAIIKQIANKYP